MTKRRLCQQSVLKDKNIITIFDERSALYESCWSHAEMALTKK